MATPLRTDSAIQKEIQEELAWDLAVTATDIGVRVAGGVVTLTGTVSHYYEKYGVERAALRIAGVRAIADEIAVASRLGSDTEIASNVVQTLAHHANIPSDRIKVLVQDGQVTLSGSVDWGEQRLEAEKAAGHIRGVVSVSNHINVTQPSVSAPEIQGGIEAAFARHARLDASKITVAVQGGHLTLSGVVSSLAEREEAEFVAWKGKGVIEVTNLLRVESGAWD